MEGGHAGPPLPDRAQKARRAMHYELWDIATGNCVGRYSSENEAMSRVRSLLAQIGAAYAEELELLEEDDLGNFRSTASGATLIDRAEAVLNPQ